MTVRLLRFFTKLITMYLEIHLNNLRVRAQSNEQVKAKGALVIKTENWEVVKNGGKC